MRSWSLLFALSLSLSPAVGVAKPLPTGSLSGLVNASTPAPIADAIRLTEAGKALSASKAIDGLLRSGDWPDHRSQLHYLMGRNLDALGMTHAAMRSFYAALDGDHRAFAMVKVVLLAERLGDRHTLRRLAMTTPVSDYPPSARSALLYHRARGLFDDDDLSGARKALEAIAPQTAHAIRGRFLEGVIAHQQSRLRPAVQAFRAVADSPDADSPDADAELRSLAILNIARVYYSLERYDEAQGFYAQVPRNTDAWATALFEGAWAQFMTDDYNASLGDLLTIRSPFFSDRYLEPEAQILETLMAFYRCDFDGTERLARGFRSRYAPMIAEMSAMPDRAPEAVWEHYFGEGESTPTVLPKAFFVEALSSSGLQGTVRHLDQIDAELALIADQRRDWQATVGATLSAQLTRDRTILQRRAGRALSAQAARTAASLDHLSAQADIILFELYDRSWRLDARRAEGLIELPKSARKERGVSMWQVDGEVRMMEPFNGEFWEDELGYYLVFPDNRCQ
ncbi:MAG: hypothetical protein AAFV53_30015 [Myxococcota bacterium]